MKRHITCPNCGSHEVELEQTSERIATAIGGLTGSLLAYFGKFDSKKVSTITGFFTGAAIGNTIGRYLDRKSLHHYKCLKCNKKFIK